MICAGLMCTCADLLYPIESTVQVYMLYFTGKVCTAAKLSKSSTKSATGNKIKSRKIVRQVNIRFKGESNDHKKVKKYSSLDEK